MPKKSKPKTKASKKPMKQSAPQDVEDRKLDPDTAEDVAAISDAQQRADANRPLASERVVSSVILIRSGPLRAPYWTWTHIDDGLEYAISVADGDPIYELKIVEQPGRMRRPKVKLERIYNGDAHSRKWGDLKPRCIMKPDQRS